MVHIVAVANQKGGVGKTTTVVNLAAFCALAGRRCLIVDNDPQGNASSVLADAYDGPSIYAGGHPLPTVYDRLAIIPSGRDLGAQQHHLVMAKDGDGLLAQALGRWDAEFDLVFIDCPPSMSVLPRNALNAAHGVLIPVQCEYYAMEGLGQLLHSITTMPPRMQAGTLRHLPVIGILLTMFDGRLNLSRAVAQDICAHFPDLTFASRIPRDVALAAAPSHGRTIIDHDPLCEGAVAYLSAAQEFLDVIDR